MYFLRFSAERPVSEPFDEVDRAYIELIGKLFAQRLRHHQHVERLRYAMEHDLLTDLPNRATLRASIADSLAARPAGALIAFDLDRFRDLVIALGRQTADAVLVEVAFALRAALRADEVLGRTGGDVFAVYLPGADRQSAFDRARHLMARFAEPFGTGDRNGTELVHVTASAGVALIPDDAGTVDELFARAEVAVDLAKAAGRDQVAFYFRPGSTAVVT
jgi:diguanylate cyclase (GGDEF)-like protein